MNATQAKMTTAIDATIAVIMLRGLGVNQSQMAQTRARAPVNQ